MQRLVQDVRYAIRQLRKSPGFAITAIVTLALGIGVNTGVFSIMDAVVLRPLAVPDLHRVVTVAEEQKDGGYQRAALGNYEDWKRESRSFEALAAFTPADLTLTGAGDAAHVEAAYASADFFNVMRIEPLLGRVFNSSETVSGRDNVAVLSYGFWQKHFGGDRDVAGRKVDLEGRNYTVIGVMPRTAQYPSSSDLFLPLAPSPAQTENRSNHDYLVIGRLRPGVTVAQAQAEIRGIASREAKAYPATNEGRTVKVERLIDNINGDYTPLYFRLVLGATLFVLLIVCANIANLQFARGIARRPELAMRTALGAGQARLLRQLLTENVLLGLMGTAGGMVVAAVVLRLSIATMPERVARFMSGWANISLNGRALGFSLLLAVGAGVASGLLPAMQALRISLVEQLKAGSRSVTGAARSHVLRNVFTVAQISLAITLVVGAALMCKGMLSLLHFADKYSPKQALTFNVYLSPARFTSAEKQVRWYEDSLDKLRSIPGAAHAEVTTALPWGNGAWVDDFRVENRAVVPGKIQTAQRVTVSGGYFAALHIPILSGRTFNSSDGINTQPTAIISRGFAERYFPGENPLGRRIQMGSGRADVQDPWVRIVGIASDVTYLWIDRETVPTVYLNAVQMPPAEGASYIVTSDGNPLALAPAARKALAAVDSAVPLDAMQTYEQYLREAFTGLMNVVAYLGVDALLALLLAAIGIFAVMANLVAERNREIGVRLTLGARREDILQMILRRAALLTGAGVALGIALAAGLARMVASLIFGVSPGDPVVFVTTVASIIGVGFLASWVPARRAASVDPAQSLRAE
ncbi:MAG TPA: ABC transporter permease [Terracidiphilus sp.]|nr:ABC transporter permease [Terracidiphilus sp.]